MTPRETAEERVRLAGEYARDAELLTDILTKKAELWVMLREGVKSDKSADKAWDSMPLGIEEMRIRLRMKAAEKQMSAMKTLIDVANGEARNSY